MISPIARGPGDINISGTDIADDNVGDVVDQQMVLGTNVIAGHLLTSSRETRSSRFTTRTNARTVSASSI